MSLEAQIRALLTTLLEPRTVTAVAAPVGPIVVTWEATPAPELPLPLQSIGTCGGWTVRGAPYAPQWQEYLSYRYDPEYWPWLEALRADWIEHNRKLIAMGDAPIVPVLSDGVTKVMAWFSNRGGGDFQAAVWNTHDPKNNYTYLDFAW